LQVGWTDGTSTSAAVVGKWRDSETLALEGTTDSTSSSFPGIPVLALLKELPPNPCVAAGNAITGELAFGSP
jgi:hypothetical protein